MNSGTAPSPQTDRGCGEAQPQRIRTKVRRKTLTRGEMSWLLRLGLATAAVRYLVENYRISI